MVRAVFSGGAAVRNGTLRLGVGERCETLAIAFTGCPRDTLTPLALRLAYDATGDPIEVAGGLRPALSEDSQTVATGTGRGDPGGRADGRTDEASPQLPFEKDCGTDNVCVDDLHVSFNFSGLETVVVGVTDVVDITVTLRNRGEDSYGTTVQLQHAEALSYRKAVVLQVVFTVTLDVPHGAELGQALEVVANATSDNGAPGGRAERAEIPVKYGVFLVLTSAPNSTKYVNVSTRAGAPPSAPVTHRYQVKVLGQRGVPVTVTFLVPTGLGGARLWDHLGVTPEQDCTVAACTELQCRVPELEPPRALGFSLGGSLALAWMAQVQTELERLEPPNPLPHILGGTAGGLLLLGLAALLLYKVGFFKRRYKELLEGDGTPPAPPGNPQG
ncbi:integrin alpha-X-like [Grus japonensis]|uniref:Integrin alpha-X-like n=1 Tax=Grus japonensis TaxID=30415 RepID=A0ABC9XXS6_GRUJA